MKQFIAIFSVLAMVLFLGACSGGTDDEDTTDDTPTVIQEEESNDAKASADYLHSGNIGQGTAGDGSDDWWKTGTSDGYSYTFTATSDVSLTVSLKAWNYETTQVDDLETFSGTSISETVTYGEYGSDYDIGWGQEDYYWVISASSEADYELTYESQ